jgi:hypothetical protein
MSGPSAAEGFSLVGGGRSRRVLTRLGLSGPDGRGVVKQAAVLAAVTWAPLLVLSAVQGLALSPSLRVPFLEDLLVHVRFLVALPLVVLAQAVIDRWGGKALQHILTSGLVKAEHAPQVEAAVRMVTALRESALFEVAILLLAYARSIVMLVSGRWELITSWRLLPLSGAPSAAEWWFLVVSLPLFNFLLYRWLWGFLIWALFLWRLSSVPLQLLPTHPDRAGGLAFLGDIQMRFAVGVAALSALLAAFIGERALAQGVPVAQAQGMLIGFVIVVPIIVLAPLGVFAPALTACRTQGLLDYAELGHGYTEAFAGKWMGEKPPEGEPLLGTSDIQSLADLANSFEVIRKMAVVPFDLTVLIVVLGAAIVPLLPLVFAVVPLADLLKRVAGALF